MEGSRLADERFEHAAGHVTTSSASAFSELWLISQIIETSGPYSARVAGSSLLDTSFSAQQESASAIEAGRPP